MGGAGAPAAGGMGPGGIDEARLKQSMDQMNAMDDSQLDHMVNMMKSNPAMMKANYEAQMGQKLTDEQFNELIKMRKRLNNSLA